MARCDNFWVGGMTTTGFAGVAGAILIPERTRLSGAQGRNQEAVRKCTDGGVTGGAWLVRRTVDTMKMDSAEDVSA